MSSELEPLIGPIRAEIAGTSAAETLKRLFCATRPEFYPAFLLPVIVGTAWSGYASHGPDVPAFVVALLATVACVLYIHWF